MRSSSLSSSLFFFHLFLLTHFIKFSLLCSLYSIVFVVKRVFVYSRWRRPADRALVKLVSVSEFLFQTIVPFHTSSFLKIAFAHLRTIVISARRCSCVATLLCRFEQCEVSIVMVRVQPAFCVVMNEGSFRSRFRRAMTINFRRSICSATSKIIYDGTLYQHEQTR